MAAHLNGGLLTEEEALAQAIAESSMMAHAAAASMPPLVSSPLPLPQLADEYQAGARADLYRAKAAHLMRSYSAIRRGAERTLEPNRRPLTWLCRLFCRDLMQPRRC